MDCVRCGGDGPHYANDKSCKECRKALVRANRKANRDYYRAYDRERGNRQEAGYVKQHRADNPKKYKAQTAVNNAVRDGRLKKLDACEHCGGQEHIVGHHVHYDLPLVVTWLCQGCHVTLHKEFNNENSTDINRSNGPVPGGFQCLSGR